MSSVNSSYSSNSRLTGMFSDLDTDALVESMCSNQQSKVDKQGQKKTTYQWYTEAMDEAMASVKEFSNTFCSTLGNSSMLKSSTYYSYNITSSSSGKAVSLTASTSASLGDYSVQVTKLAENSNIASSSRVSSGGLEISSSNTATLGELSFANALQFDDTGNISFQINGSKFKFSKDTSLQSMINTINNDITANVTMKYSRITDGFTITADTGGSKSSLNITNISGDAFGADGAFMINQGIVRNGCDSIALINGTAVTRDSNEYPIDGITFELNKVTAGTAEETIDFCVERDYGSTVAAISAFIDGLNKLITTLTSLTSADDNSYDYPPLTSAQRKDMSEDEIKSWETKAKSGVLHKDPALSALISGLKDAFFSKAGGTDKSATAIGISSGGYYNTDKGLIVIDSDALNAALKSDPETVISMFTAGSSTAQSHAQGIIYKIRNAMSAYQEKATYSISNTKLKIRDTDTEINKLEDKLDTLAGRYYERFSAMETALATLNSQASYISQLLSS